MWVYIEWRRISFTLHGRKSIQMNNKTNIARWNWRRWHFNMSTRLLGKFGWRFNNQIELIWKTNAFNSNWSVNALHDTRMKNTQRTVPVKQKIERKSKIKWNFRRMSNKLRKSYWNCLVKNTFYMQALWFLIFYSWLLKAEHANQQEIKHETKKKQRRKLEWIGARRKVCLHYCIQLWIIYLSINRTVTPHNINMVHGNDLHWHGDKHSLAFISDSLRYRVLILYFLDTFRF